MGCVTWQVFTQDKDLEKDGIDSCGRTGLVLHWYYELYDTHINVKYLYDYLFWNLIYLILWQSWNFYCHYSSNLILQKHFLLSMLKTVVLLNIFYIINAFHIINVLLCDQHHFSNLMNCWIFETLNWMTNLNFKMNLWLVRPFLL